MNLAKAGGFAGSLAPLLVAVALAAGFIWEIHRLDRQPGPRPSPEMRQALARGDEGAASGKG